MYTLALWFLLSWSFRVFQEVMKLDVLKWEVYLIIWVTLNLTTNILSQRAQRIFTEEWWKWHEDGVGRLNVATLWSLEMKTKYKEHQYRKSTRLCSRNLNMATGVLNLTQWHRCWTYDIQKWKKSVSVYCSI